MNAKPHKKSHYESKEKRLHCPVVGLNYRMIPPQQAKLAAKVPILASFQREPTNLYDGNAVEVWIDNDTLHIGYVPRDIAARLAPKIDSGEIQIVSVWITEIDSGTGVGQLLITYRKKIRN
jgi:hypothetical protein